MGIESIPSETGPGTAFDDEGYGKTGKERGGIDTKFCQEMEKIEQEIAALAKELDVSPWHIKKMMGEALANPGGVGLSGKEKDIWERLDDLNRRTAQIENKRDGALRRSEAAMHEE